MPALRREWRLDFVVVNGENAADGVGLTPKLAQKLLATGVDAITLGNHTYRRKEAYEYLVEEAWFAPIVALNGIYFTSDAVTVVMPDAQVVPSLRDFASTD